tara:strand:+ start:1744 stop:3741 length:1998 start_codon:yes stop_codon:yes gene_type:complete
MESFKISDTESKDFIGAVRDSAKDEQRKIRRDNRGFGFGNIGNQLASQLLFGVAQPVVDDAIKSVNTFLYRPFDNNRKAWMASKEQQNRKRIGERVYQETHYKDKRRHEAMSQGKTDKEFHFNETQNEVTDPLIALINKGALKDESNNPYTMERLGGRDGIMFLHLRDSIAQDQADATYQAYLDWNKEKSDLTTLADFTDMHQRLNPKARGPVGWVGNKVKSLLGADLIKNAEDAIAKDSIMINTLEVRDALDNLKKFGGDNETSDSLINYHLTNKSAIERFKTAHKDSFITEQVTKVTKGSDGTIVVTPKMVENNSALSPYEGKRVIMEGFQFVGNNRLTNEYTSRFQMTKVRPFKQRTNQDRVDNLAEVNIGGWLKSFNKEQRGYAEKRANEIFEKPINILNIKQHVNDPGFIEKYEQYLIEISRIAQRADAYDDGFSEKVKKDLATIRATWTARMELIGANPLAPENAEGWAKLEEIERNTVGIREGWIQLDENTGRIVPVGFEIDDKGGLKALDESIPAKNAANLRKYEDFLKRDEQAPQVYEDIENNYGSPEVVSNDNVVSNEKTNTPMEAISNLNQKVVADSSSILDRPKSTTLGDNPYRFKVDPERRKPSAQETALREEAKDMWLQITAADRNRWRAGKGDILGQQRFIENYVKENLS